MVNINRYWKAISYNMRKAWEARIPEGIVCHPYKFIYFPVPKAACSSLKQMIADICGLEQKSNPNFIDFEWVSGQRLHEFPDYFRFTVVRNPWDRLASCYENKIKSYFPYTFNRYNQVLQVKIFYPEMPFKQFVKRVVLIPDLLSDEHFRSQKRLVCDPKGHLLVHKVAKLENLDEDLTDIFKKLQLPNIKIPHFNQTSSCRYKDYKDYYNDQLWDLVARRYRSDIEMFGYIGDDYSLC